LTSDQPVARPLPTQDNTTQTDADKHPCLERDSNPRFQQLTGQDPRFRPHGHCDWPGGTWGERRYSSYSFTSILDGVSGQRHAPAALYPGRKDPHWIGDYVGPRAGLDAGAAKKIFCPCRGSNSDRPARSQTLYCLSYRGSKFGVNFHK
jgi:hypothetical protein